MVWIKRAHFVLSLFKTFLVFPNWTKSRPVWGFYWSIFTVYFLLMNDFSDEFQGYSLLKAYSPLSPKLSASHFVELWKNYALLILYILPESTLYSILLPQQGHIVISFPYSKRTACTLWFFFKRLRNCLQPIRFLHKGISFLFFWLLSKP